MKRASVVVLFACLMAAFLVTAQTPEGNKIVRLNSALDAIVSSDAKVEKLPDSPGPDTREGPTWIRKGGYLLYSDMGAKVINKWNPRDNKVSVFQERTGSDGITLDRQGRIVYCAHGDHQIVRLEKDGGRTTLAREYQGRPLESPNDLVYKSDGSLYFTDTGSHNPGVYLLKGTELQMLINDMPKPNGLAFSPDEHYLYINDSARRTITRFDMQPDDTIHNGQLVVDMNAGHEPCKFPCPDGYPDGMKVDKKGNIYSTGPGGIWIMSPDGTHLGTIQITPDRPSNLGFGDSDGKTIYITCRPGLYKVRFKIPGIRP
ncbi:MAG: SMP-30/gluconolactonase/LRE family protein [Candidatus Acidiferrales bacterium]